jgi:glycosyltransferase involved in cell wall biosynthesis
MMTANTDAMVSVVIPSLKRPVLVGRAAQSALNQAWRRIGVIVIIDGPDEETVQQLRQFDDPRLRVLRLERSAGVQQARNIGVQESRGSWVAFLDDDDEWSPATLEQQLVAARASRWSSPLVSRGLTARSADGGTITPQRESTDTESVAEYLFLRRNSGMSEIRLQTATLTTKRIISTGSPGESASMRDLLLRASVIEGVGLAFFPEPLTIWHSDAGTERLSKKRGWWLIVEWFRSVRHRIGPGPFASFLLSNASAWARSEQDWTAFIAIPWEALRHGSLIFGAVLDHVARWLLPLPVRRGLNKLRVAPSNISATAQHRCVNAMFSGTNDLQKFFRRR